LRKRRPAREKQVAIIWNTQHHAANGEEAVRDLIIAERVAEEQFQNASAT